MTKNNINWDTASQYKKNQKSDRWQSKQSLFHMLMLLMGIALLSASSCKKDPVATDSYPAVTSEGKNIWACKINGSPVVYSGVPTFGNENGVSVTAYTSSGIQGLTIFGSLTKSPTDDTEQTIEFEVNQIVLNKKYFFNKDTAFYTFIDYNASKETNGYKSFQNSGWIKFSRFDQVIAGEFELKGIDKYDTDTANITEGRFDIKR